MAHKYSHLTYFAIAALGGYAQSVSLYVRPEGYQFNTQHYIDLGQQAELPQAFSTSAWFEERKPLQTVPKGVPVLTATDYEQQLELHGIALDSKELASPPGVLLAQRNLYVANHKQTVVMHHTDVDGTGQIRLVVKNGRMEGRLEEVPTFTALQKKLMQDHQLPIQDIGFMSESERQLGLVGNGLLALGRLTHYGIFANAVQGREEQRVRFKIPSK